MKKSLYLLLALPFLSFGQSLDFTNLQDIPTNYLTLLTTSQYNDKIIINCGSDGVGGYDFLYQYDTTNDSWSIINTSTNLIVKSYANGEIINDNLYLFNGYNNSFLEIVNLLSGEVTYGTNNPLPRRIGGSATINNGVYVFGGGIGPSVYTNKLHYYDVGSDSWTELADMPDGRETRGEIINNKIYAVGGFNGNVSNKIDVYNINTNQWDNQFTMPFASSAHSLTVYNDLIFILGDYTELDRIAYFDTFNEVFVIVANNMIGRRHSDAEIINDYLYITGGNYTTSIEQGGWLNSTQRANLSELLSIELIDSINKLTIYPNPSSDYVIINGDTLNDYKYNVYDSSGRMVLVGVGKYDNKISLNNIKKGVYFIEIILSEFSKTFKILKR